MLKATAGIPVQVGDIIDFQSAANAAFGLKCTVNIQTDDGVKVRTTTTQTSNSDRSTKTSDPLSLDVNGIVTSAGVDITSGAFPAAPGSLFVWCYLRKVSRVLIATLLSGYMYQGYPPPSFPGTLYGAVGPLGTGRLYTASGTDPAAGAEVADTVPARTKWLLKAVEVVLVTDANAANRNVNLFVDDAGATVTRALLLTDTTNQTASLTRTHGWYPGTDNSSTASVSVTDTVTVLAKYPMSLQRGIWLKAGDNIRTVTTAIQATDNYGAPRYVVEEWITG